MAARFQFTEGTTSYLTYKRLAWAAFIILILIVAFAYADTGQIILGGNKYSLSIGRLSKAVSFMIAILGLQVVVGYTGQIALGQSFFFGTGAYTAAYLVQDQSWPWLLTLAVIVPSCFLLGMLFGLPALRIRGLYLALVTLGLAAIFPALAKIDALEKYTAGSAGKAVDRDKLLSAPSWLPLNGIANALQKLPLFGSYFGEGDLSSREADRMFKFFMFTILAFVCFWLVGNMLKSRPGRAIRAIRDNETSAAVSGIDLARFKTISFGIASALGGVGGMVYVAELGIASPDDFTQLLAINFIVGLVVGGVGTLPGAVVGGLVIAFVPDWASETSSFPLIPERWLTGPTGTLILGVMLIVLTFFLPGGIVSGARRLKARFVSVTPRAPELATVGVSE
jgi:branched-chain amino acid transport system permease protein